ncbi:hypothetical protein ND748_32265, partial [Frankia sp. AiPs1]|nr:hypothetical protein [Frankia sp. AiPs1]
MARYLRIGPGWDYALLDGQWQPAPDDRHLPYWAEENAAEENAAADLPAAPCGTRRPRRPSGPGGSPPAALAALAAG